MKKLTTIIALALLAVAGTGYAVTCAYDNVPGATLLVPNWRVSRNGGQPPADIPAVNPAGSTVDTLCAITNVSSTGIIVHATLWTKYSKAVLDWNIPMTGFDALTFSMRDILNGNLNNNPNVQKFPTTGIDACGANQLTQPTAPNAFYLPSIGWGGAKYIRFSNPNATDSWAAIGYYKTPAYTGNFRKKVWASLANSGDITTFTNPFSSYILDIENPGCTGVNAQQPLQGDFSGYLTLDVNNYCSRFFPDTPIYWTQDALATIGWAPTYTPNCIMGDVFYMDNGGVVAGDPMVSLEFDLRLQGLGNGIINEKTFYAKYWEGIEAAGPVAQFSFVGDGREPLANHYGFRYYNNPTAPTYAAGGQTFLTVWRSDRYYNNASIIQPQTDPPAYAAGLPPEVNLCNWWLECLAPATTNNCVNTGLGGTNHLLDGVAIVYDMDEATYTPAGAGGPSGDVIPTTHIYVFLESQRIALAGNQDLIAGIASSNNTWTMGWVDLTFRGFTDPARLNTQPYNQSWVGVQHIAPGAGAMNVGHAGTLLSNQFQCVNMGTGQPIFPIPGNIN